MDPLQWSGQGNALSSTTAAGDCLGSLTWAHIKLGRTGVFKLLGSRNANGKEMNHPGDPSVWAGSALAVTSH